MFDRALKSTIKNGCNNPSLISLMVSVDVKHHVSLLTYLLLPVIFPSFLSSYDIFVLYLFLFFYL